MTSKFSLGLLRKKGCKFLQIYCQNYFERQACAFYPYFQNDLLPYRRLFHATHYTKSSTFGKESQKSKVKLGVFKWLGWNHSGETWREVVASWVLTCIDGTDTSNVGPFSAYARFLQTREIRCSPLVFWQVVGRGPPPTPFGFPSHPAVTISTLSSYTARKLRRRVPSGPEHNFSASSEREPALFFESLATTTCPFVKPER